uniref:Uncharacterized protein n=1 Tax=Kuenenia stuttgartiensis TaxID=174633 RepID=Q1Q5Y1_KUEST|nr:unknown protein [Candidatus Kuenenia stuttgartiensis]
MGNAPFRTSHFVFHVVICFGFVLNFMLCYSQTNMILEIWR